VYALTNVLVGRGRWDGWCGPLVPPGGLTEMVVWVGTNCGRNWNSMVMMRGVRWIGLRGVSDESIRSEHHLQPHLPYIHRTPQQLRLVVLHSRYGPVSDLERGRGRQASSVSVSSESKTKMEMDDGRWAKRNGKTLDAHACGSSPRWVATAAPTRCCVRCARRQNGNMSDDCRGSYSAETSSS
jgi:hypothetical protein